jgi:hypothetical protein
VGFLDRLRGRDDDGTPQVEDAGDAGTAGSGAVEAVEPVEEIGIRPLSPDEEADLDEARAGYAAHGIDPADLSTIAEAYDRALDRVDDGGDAATSEVVAVLGTAIGDHLVAVAGYRWVMSTDPFGTDLAVEPPRRGVPVVTRMLVAVRWMARERGWVTGVVGHLADVGRR